MEYTILNPPKLLKEGDCVTFEFGGKKYLTVVMNNYVEIFPHDRKMFQDLGLLDGEDESKLCNFFREAYGYGPISGIWPAYRTGDFAATTRAIWMLFGLSLQHGSPLDTTELINPEGFFEDYFAGEALSPIKGKLQKLFGVTE